MNTFHIDAKPNQTNKQRKNEWKIIAALTEKNTLSERFGDVITTLVQTEALMLLRASNLAFKRPFTSFFRFVFYSFYWCSMEFQLFFTFFSCVHTIFFRLDFLFSLITFSIHKCDENQSTKQINLKTKSDDWILYT